MKVPVWEAGLGSLAALLNTGRFAQCDLHTFTLTGGAGVIRIAAADCDLTYPGGPRWSSRGARIDPAASRQTGHWKRGLDVDTWQTIILPRVFDPITGDEFPDKINGVPWTAACRQGALDGADYQIDRAYFPAWPVPYASVFEPIGIITMFAGMSAEVDVSDTAIAITANDYRTLLGTKEPHKVYQAGCGHTLFDAGCSLHQADFATPMALLGGSSRSVLRAAPVPAPGSGTFTLGSIVMTSGLNASFSRTVAFWDGAGSFSLLNPLPYEVVAGDTFDAFPGCDKQQATCTAFANLANYGGESFIPSPEAAI